MKIIFNSDDFGLTYSLTEGTRECFKKGVITSTSIRTNGPAYKYASSLAKKELKKIGLGLHLNLTDGIGQQNLLIKSGGYYKYDFFGLWRMLLRPNKGITLSIEKELESQFRQAHKDNLDLDHVDSEKHVHMIPPIFEIVCRLCKKYGIESVRLVREPFYLADKLTDKIYPLLNLNIVKFSVLNLFAREDYDTLIKHGLKKTDRFYGVLYTNHMTFPVLKNIILHAKKNSFKILEISSHPGYPDDKRDTVYTSDEIAKYGNQKNRLVEANTLRSKELMNFLKSQKIETITYKNI